MRLTASKLALLSKCGFWALPSTPWGDNGSAAATAGNEAHAGFESLTTGEAVLLPEAARNKTEALRPVLAELHARGTPAGTTAEVAFAWDPATDKARVLGIGGRHHYTGATEGELCGTADLVIRCPDDSLIVADYKNHVIGRTVDARQQLRALALMAARALGSEQVQIYTVMVGEDDAFLVNEGTLDVFALLQEVDVLRDAVAQLGLPQEPRPGPWCRDRYCPAIPQCPATVTALAEILPAESIVPRHRLTGPLGSPDEAAFRLTAYDLIEGAIKAGRADLRAYADAHAGIPLPDGSIWIGSEVTSEKPALDVPGALDVVRRAGGDEAVTSTLAWAALERTIGKPDAKRVREELVAIGAVKVTSYKRYEPRKPKKGRAA